MAVERAFGKLKGRWRILNNSMDFADLETIVDVIDVCCILHNLCINCDDLWEQCEEDETFVCASTDIYIENDTRLLTQAREKRNRLVHQLFEQQQ